jgi:bifunctional DNA-binding transcriptional regulator/antitoxin component of YhaV-PrlF toxin-antitoxin module
MIMRYLMISKGGQISVPADVRRRWGTRRLRLEDRGDEIVITPAPEDPIAAARGIFKGRSKYTSEELRRLERAEEAEIEERKWGPS